ncbi:maleylpyruvate isomerase family mycothiol-dependent enzyme [Nocardioides sp. NPDC057577]|uniref:maleylpyruvate isomerase family mycothiol-dependent enzyme n=1 Tax=Nocardioides sp. NPDC057577 TaxID=3346171 RepID=UPI0036714608
MSTWNFMDASSKETLLDLVRREAEGMFALVATDEAWGGPTAAGEWTAANVIGHLVDTTETYFVGFDAAAGKGEGPAPVPLTDMAVHVDAGARQLEAVPRVELIERLRTALARELEIFEGLSAEEWMGLQVPHKYMGQLPAAFYPVFALVDYTLHSWDIREGLGRPHALAADSADMLIPLCNILWANTVARTPAEKPIEVGINITSGAHAGGIRMTLGAEGLQQEPGSLEGVETVIDFDPASFVLTAYGRINAGTVNGDTTVAAEFLSSFYRI